MNKTLQQLHQDVARKGHLNAVLRDFYAWQRELKTKVDSLDAQRIKEQADVDRLEGRSLAAFFYHVIGKMDEKLDRERTEAYAAAVRYDAAVRELADVEDQIARSKTEIASLLGCEDRYARALTQRLEAIKAAGGTDARTLLHAEEELCRLQSQQKELEEAILAGTAALSILEQVEHHISQADSYSTWDMLGGGLMAGLAKHDELDAAQNEIERLQFQLRRFKTELADVNIQADVQIALDDFTRFADIFFDGLFADLAVQDEINRAWQEVKTVRSQVESMLSRLHSMDMDAQARYAQLRTEQERIALTAES